MKGIDKAVSAYKEVSKKTHEDVHQQSKLVAKAGEAYQQWLKKPTSDKHRDKLAALIGQVQEFANENRGSKVFNHLCAVAEFIPALGCQSQPEVGTRFLFGGRGVG